MSYWYKICRGFLLALSLLTLNACSTIVSLYLVQTPAENAPPAGSASDAEPQRKPENSSESESETASEN